MQDGIGAFNISIDFDTREFDYVEGSASTAEGGFFSINEKNASLGSLATAGIYQSKFTDFNSPLLSFQAEIENNSSSYQVSLTEIALEDVDIVNIDHVFTL